MSARIARWAVWGLGITMATSVVACGGGGGTTTAPAPSITPTRPPSATATPPSGAAGVAGLVVPRNDLTAGAPETLAPPPPNWASPADAKNFEHAMGSADWSVDGAVSKRGVTGPDGRFAIGDLPPGQYTFQVSKTLNGNLLPLTIPFTVGDDGRAEIVVEVGAGLVRTTIAYTQAGALVHEVHGPYGNVLVTRDGRISELGDASRTLVDANGDGKFDTGPCAANPIQACDAAGACPSALSCQCVPSCPACDDCGAGICTISTLPQPQLGPYRCSAAGTCAQPGDQCTCVPSCPDCKDCALSVCIPGCAPVEISSITVNAPAQLVVGRTAQATASAQLSDGSAIDVTYLASWQSSNESVATIDSWGTISALAIGDTDLTASVGPVQSAPQPLSVVERPTLQQILVQNQSCFCPPGPLGAPAVGAALQPCIFNSTPSTDILPVPSCGQVVQIGATLQFSAIGQFADGSYDDISKDVQWQVLPSDVGDVVDGLFTARAAGTAKLTAALNGVVSDPTEIRVVTQPTIDSLSIYPANWGYIAVAGGPVSAGAPEPCFNCGAAVTVLRGDQLQFQATAHYDTGDWRDVTDSVTWRSSDAATATIDGSVMTAVQGGDVVIDAVLDSVTSNPVNVHIVNEATLQSISIYQEGTDRVVAKGDQRFFHATGYYDVGITRDITSEAIWRSSDDSIGGFDTPGTFTGRAAGTVQVWAQLDEQTSAPLSIEVFELSELAYCDPNNINRAVWSDAFNRVTLESDCATYAEPGLVTLRYTVTETQPHGGIFDPCLDLFVYQGEQPVRTIRNEGCGAPFLPGAAPDAEDAALKYQLRAFWDLRDDSGALVPSGDYVIYGRFYLYYDPVVKLPITVGSGSEPPPTRTPTPVPNPAVVISIDAVSAMSGTQATFGVRLKAEGATVVGVQDDIVFDTRLPIDQTSAGSPNCVVNPAINKPQTAFSFLPAGCQPGVDCDTVRALVVAFNNLATIPSGALLYTCSVSVPQAAMNGTYPLRCAAAAASDANEQPLAVRCLDGAITVGSMSPPPSPVPGSDVEGACYIGSSKCTGSYFGTAQSKCCNLFRLGAQPEAISWCPNAQLDATTGQCTVCASTPCDGLPDSAAPGAPSNQPPFRLSSLDEHCGDQTGAAIVSSVQPEYDVTLSPLRPGSEINLPSAISLTIRLAYQGGDVTCYPAFVPPPGSTLPVISEQVGIVMDMQFLTEGGAFNEQFETEIKGRAGYASFSYSTTPDKLHGTYRPDLPGYEAVGVGFWGNFGGDGTNGGVDKSGVPPGHVSELTFVAQW